jgi:CubicO group peptidase (beta-lactamase class C family)
MRGKQKMPNKQFFKGGGNMNKIRRLKAIMIVTVLTLFSSQISEAETIDVGMASNCVAATDTEYNISGTVTGVTGNVQAGVTVALSGDCTGEEITAGDGTYSISVDDTSIVTVTPSLSGYSFTPANTPVTISGSDVTGVDFTSVADVIDDDIDDDGVLNENDDCEDTPVGEIVNPSNGCSIEQLVPCNGNWKNHGQYVSASTKVLKSFVRQGLITKKGIKAFMKKKASSDCGKKGKTDVGGGITIFGEITGEICKSRKITVLVSDCNDNRIVDKTLDGDSTYSISIPSSYSGEKVAFIAYCDEDNDGEFSIGDHVGQDMVWHKLQQTNEVDIDINKEITATVEGEVSCGPYTDKPIYITAWGVPLNPASPPLYIGGPVPLVNLNEKTSYKVLLTNTSPGSEVWLRGLWDQDGSGVCHDPVESVCDYTGFAASFILNNVEMTGVNIDACSSKTQPCMVETPQDKYAIDNLPGADTPLYELDEEILAELVNQIEAGDFGNIHSLIIIHNDRLVLEEYFMGWTRHMRHRSFSVVKSFTSALIGIAVDQGWINDLDEKLLSFFPEYDDIEHLDERKESITLENVLTMSAGFPWEELSRLPTDPENDLYKLVISSDWIKYMLDLPMSDDPGTKFVYNSGGAILLSGILANKTGQSAEEFAEDNLFNTLGISNWEWEAGPNEITNASWGLSLHPVNFAMFGYLYLKNGLLNGEQVVSEDWVNESTSNHIDPYGYQWWMLHGYSWWDDMVVEAHPGTDGAYQATGYGGQLILVLPNLNMVLVSTAEDLVTHQLPKYRMLLDYILPALKEN